MWKRGQIAMHSPMRMSHHYAGLDGKETPVPEFSDTSKKAG